MQGVDVSQMDALTQRIEKLITGLPAKRRELHKKIATLLQHEVQKSIGDSGLNDDSGKVKSWQEQYIGSKGGYAAVRATDKGSGKYPSTGPNSPGAVTNYLESGHKIPYATHAAKLSKKGIYVKSRKVRYGSGRNGLAWVEGRHFYAKTIALASSIDTELRKEIEKFTDDICKSLEGKP